MNIKEYLPLIIKNLNDLKYKSEYIGSPGDKNYKASNLSTLRDAINNLSPIDIINE